MAIAWLVVMVWTTLAGEPWFGIGVCLGLWWVRGMWRYVWPATRRRTHQQRHPELYPPYPRASGAGDD